MTFWDFADKHPWLDVLVILVGGWVLAILAESSGKWGRK